MNLSYSCPVRSTGAYIITSTLLSSFVVQHRHLLQTTINISTTSEHLVVNIVVVLITVTSSVNSNNIKPRAILLLLIESVFLSQYNYCAYMNFCFVVLCCCVHPTVCEFVLLFGEDCCICLWCSGVLDNPQECLQVIVTNFKYTYVYTTDNNVNSAGIITLLPDC